MLVLANGLYAVAAVLDVVLQVYMWILIIRAVLSWVSPDPRNPIVAFLGAVTDPLLRVVRRRLPMNLRYFPLDIAFLVLFGLVLFGRYFLVQSLMDYAQLLRARELGGVVIRG